MRVPPQTRRRRRRSTANRSIPRPCYLYLPNTVVASPPPSLSPLLYLTAPTHVCIIPHISSQFRTTVCCFFTIRSPSLACADAQSPVLFTSTLPISAIGTAEQALRQRPIPPPFHHTIYSLHARPPPSLPPRIHQRYPHTILC